jgi:uncharacterized protein YbaP (TraB family)
MTLRFPRFARFSRFSRFAAFAAFAAIVSTVALATPIQAQSTRNFIWKITGPRGAQPARGAIYLVGSIHLLTKDYYPLNPALDTAFKDSDLLVEEANLDEVLAPSSQMLLLGRGLLPANQTLDKVVTPATYALVTERVKALGMPIEPLSRFKPWMLAMTLVEFEWQKAGFDAALGLDKHFHDRAKVDGKAVQGLETVEFQVSLFDQMTADEQEHMLANSLKNIDTEQANVVKLTNAWKAGDVATVERIMLDDVKDDPALYQRLLVARNRTWLPKLEALFPRAGHAFVVVGAAHLVGPDGLLATLRAKGYQVDQL